MSQKCRFCKLDSLALAYPSNKTGKEIDPAFYACTNCGFGLHGDIVKCQNCHLCFVDEKVRQKQISTYYEVAKDDLYFKEQKAREKTFGHYLKRLERMIPKKGRLLDIGTNTGLFVKLSLDNGWDAVGLEPNIWAVRYAKKNYGINLVAKPFTDRAFSPSEFDVITMWDVIEHFTDPISEIKRVFRMLKPGGVFVFSTVDPESLLAKSMGTKWPWFMEMHKVFLPQKASRFYLNKIGFSKISFFPHWRYLSFGYFSSRLNALHPFIAKLFGKVVRATSLSKVMFPYWANDLYDCFAFKQ